MGESGGSFQQGLQSKDKMTVSQNEDYQYLHGWNVVCKLYVVFADTKMLARGFQSGMSPAIA